ncbi:MAG: hypothetical protein PHR06_03930 [Candidatus Cloacimonetes bacterium]|nr:hypothetical protein [Candidatus Cloacimonadota bacterium]
MKDKPITRIVRNEILDKILAFLMSFDAPIFKEMLDKISPSKIDMDFVAEATPEYEWEDYMKVSFEKKLLFKNYISKDVNGNLSITEHGREFKRKGGYAAIDKRENQEDTIREKTIESFKYGKLALFISIVAIIISIIGLLLQK